MNAHRPELAWLLAAGAFLLVCTVLAIAAWFVFKSGEQGKTKLNGAAGCAIGFALAAIALLMALVTTFAIAVSAGRWIAREIHDNGHFGWRIESGDDESSSRPLPAPESESSDAPGDGVLTLVFTRIDEARVDEILAKARELSPGDMASATSVEVEGGEEHTRLEIQFYVGESGDEALRALIESAWPNGAVEGGGHVEIEPR